MGYGFGVDRDLLREFADLWIRIWFHITAVVARIKPTTRIDSLDVANLKPQLAALLILRHSTDLPRTELLGTFGAE